MPALTPKEIVARKTGSLPEEVYEAFNELLTRKFAGSAVILEQDEVLTELLLHLPGETEVTLLAKGFLDVEVAYRAAGWRVLHSRPGYRSQGEHRFTFSLIGPV